MTLMLLPVHGPNDFVNSFVNMCHDDMQYIYMCVNLECKYILLFCVL